MTTEEKPKKDPMNPRHVVEGLLGGVNAIEVALFSAGVQNNTECREAFAMLSFWSGAATAHLLEKATNEEHDTPKAF